MARKEIPSLQVTFTYDHAAGNFKARLANGASFVVERQHLNGRLENALQLYRGGVVAMLQEDARKAPASREFEYAYSPEMVKRYDRRGLPEISLDDLDLDLGDLELELG